jgi:hypothetical protein
LFWGDAREVSLKRSLENVGLPDKSHFKQLNRLPMPSNNHPIPPLTKVLGAYATPDFNTSMSLPNLLFRLIFTASKT